MQHVRGAERDDEDDDDDDDLPSPAPAVDVDIVAVAKAATLLKNKELRLKAIETMRTGSLTVTTSLKVIESGQTPAARHLWPLLKPRDVKFTALKGGLASVGLKVDGLVWKAYSSKKQAGAGEHFKILFGPTDPIKIARIDEVLARDIVSGQQTDATATAFFDQVWLMGFIIKRVGAILDGIARDNMRIVKRHTKEQLRAMETVAQSQARDNAKHGKLGEAEANMASLQVQMATNSGDAVLAADLQKRVAAVNTIILAEQTALADTLDSIKARYKEMLDQRDKIDLAAAAAGAKRKVDLGAERVSRKKPKAPRQAPPAADPALADLPPPAALPPAAPLPAAPLPVGPPPVAAPAPEAQSGVDAELDAMM